MACSGRSLNFVTTFSWRRRSYRCASAPPHVWISMSGGTEAWPALRTGTNASGSHNGARLPSLTLIFTMLAVATPTSEEIATKQKVGDPVGVGHRRQRLAIDLVDAHLDTAGLHNRALLVSPSWARARGPHTWRAAAGRSALGDGPGRFARSSVRTSSERRDRREVARSSGVGGPGGAVHPGWGGDRGARPAGGGGGGLRAPLAPGRMPAAVCAAARECQLHGCARDSRDLCALCLEVSFEQQSGV